MWLLLFVSVIVCEVWVCSVDVFEALILWFVRTGKSSML
jgi:hypothetical protein